MTAPLVQQQFEKLAEPINARRLAVYTDALKLGAGTHGEATVPTGANMVIISGETDMYIKAGVNPTAAVPGAAVTDGTASILVKAAAAEDNRTFICVPGQKISIVCVAATIVTLEWFN